VSDINSVAWHGMAWCDSYVGNTHQVKNENMAVLRCREDHGLLATLLCTSWLHSAHAAASLSRNLLLSRDRRPSQWWLRNHVSPCGRGHAATSQWSDNGAARLTVCMFLSDYHKSNTSSKYWKSEFKF